jgi:hypothetical protein
VELNMTTQFDPNTARFVPAARTTNPASIVTAILSLVILALVGGTGVLFLRQGALLRSPSLAEPVGSGVGGTLLLPLVVGVLAGLFVLLLGAFVLALLAKTFAPPSLPPLPIPWPIAWPFPANVPFPQPGTPPTPPNLADAWSNTWKAFDQFRQMVEKGRRDAEERAEQLKAWVQESAGAATDEMREQQKKAEEEADQWKKAGESIVSTGGQILSNMPKPTSPF